jgi:hypothetical protein
MNPASAITVAVLLEVCKDLLMVFAMNSGCLSVRRYYIRRRHLVKRKCVTNVMVTQRIISEGRPVFGREFLELGKESQKLESDASG